MTPQKWTSIGAIFGLISVGLGAFGAHALRPVLSESSVALYQTAVNYQMSHALALILFGIWSGQVTKENRVWIGFFFTLGILLFSGSLYALALTGSRQFGWVTPFGGVSLLLGWILFAIRAWRA